MFDLLTPYSPRQKVSRSNSFANSYLPAISVDTTRSKVFKAGFGASIGLSIRLSSSSEAFFTSSEMLDREARVDLDMLSCNARVLCQRDEHVRAVLEISLHSNWLESANRTTTKPQKQAGIQSNVTRKEEQEELTSFPNAAASFNAPIFSSPYSNPHSVNNSPGSTALHLTFLPCVFATHFTKCSCAAFVTL
jgi:hypothetical protein